jgi:hypothetical protein
VAAKPPLSEKDVEWVLRALEPLSGDRTIVLVGGQAIAFWTRFLALRSPEIGALGPLTSKDIDFEGSARAARQAAVLLGGTARIASLDDQTPNTGIVVFRDSEGIEREIDFINEPLGLRARDVRDTAVRVLISGGAPSIDVPLWVMHPERCMESRIYNVQILHHADEFAMRQLSASVACAREWSRFLLDDRSRSPGEAVRAVLRLNERIFRKCLRDLHFRAIYREGIVDPFDAVLVDDGQLPEEFRGRRYQQMCDRLDRRRREGSI